MIPIRDFILSALSMSAQHPGLTHYVVWKRHSKPRIVTDRDQYAAWGYGTVAECLDGELLYCVDKYRPAC